MGTTKVLCVYFQTLTFHTNTATHYSWQCTVFIISDDINIPEALNWKIAFAVVVVWVLVYMYMVSGIVCSGEVNYYQLHIYIYIYVYIYTECPRRNVKYFGRGFLMLNYTDITQNTYVQS